MTIGAPWGFGINRQEIQQLVRELVIIGTGFPPEQVFLTDTAARAPQPARNWASIQLANPIGVRETGNCERIWQSKERWMVTVNTVAGDPQRLTILGIDYDYTATSADTTETRDGLLAAIVAPVGFTAVAVGTDQIEIESTVDGQRLQVASGAGNDFTIVRNRGNAFIRNLRPFQVQCNIVVNAMMSLTDPDTTEGGQNIADSVHMIISDRLMTDRMRQCGHVPVRVSRLFNGGPQNKQQLNESTVQVIISTTGRLDVDISSVTSIPIEVTATQ